MMTKKSAVILLNGPDFNSTEFNEMISENIFLIAADGGIGHISGTGIPVDVHAGDFDSSGPESGIQVREKISFPRDKDISDFSICLDIALERGIDDIKVFGAFGGRSDHFISNYDTAVRFAEKGVRITFVGNTENIYFISSPAKFYFPAGSTVSVYSGTEKVSNIKLKGFKYKVEKHELYRLTPVGLSNVVTEKDQHVSLDAGVLAVFFNKTKI